MIQRWKPAWWLAVLQLVIHASSVAQTDDRLIGVWTFNDGFQAVDYTFRTGGRYEIYTRSLDPVFDFSSSELGRYAVEGQVITFTPYEFFGSPSSRVYEYLVIEASLSLTRIDFPLEPVAYQYQPGSREEVLARQDVDSVLIGTWRRPLIFFGRAEYTFRPGGYYFLMNIPDDPELYTEVIRGRYTQEGNQLVLKPYSGIEAQYELDFYGDTLSLIDSNDFSGHFNTFKEVPGSQGEVLAKAAAAEAFLSTTNWQVGVWEISNGVNIVELTFRPDSHYLATNSTEILRGMVRGRYQLEPRRIHFFPFIGQSIYSRDNGDFGKVERTRELDYYDGVLQIIDLEALSRSVALAVKRPGSDAVVAEKTRQAQSERARPDWFVGVWEVKDPAGWMEFTFRPDQRYIAKSGSDGVPSEVERGRFVFAPEKVTLAPYSGLGAARGFELDLYDGNLFLVGDSYRMVVARKIAGSEASVIAKTQNPEAMKGERGPILGRWTANLPGQFSELTFRPDGQFRLNRCTDSSLSQDYGLYSVNLASRSLVYDSRFVPVQSQGLDFYGNTLTIFGGLGAPRTYTVNLGTVDASIEASLAADAAEAVIDNQWMTRVPIAPRDPGAIHTPGGDIPADPFPTRIFDSPTVFTSYRMYRWLIPGLVYFFEGGTIKSVAVLHSREWHFFATGRVMVRFKNYSAGPSYPTVVSNITTSWGAYRVEPKPAETDILHIYADNGVLMEMDNGEQVEMTLEDGRRNLFWGKDYMILSEWATERKPIPCQGSANPDLSLLNTRVSLTTTIPPDPTEDPADLVIKLSRTVSGEFTLSGTSSAAGTLVVERASSLADPVAWQPYQTNAVGAGAFSFTFPQGTSASGFFRVRRP
jgi:hypothetical protein